MERRPRRASGAARLAALALCCFAAAASAEEPAPPPAPEPGRAAGTPPKKGPEEAKPPIPDPDPYLAMTGATLAGVARDGSAAFVRMTRDGVTQLFRIDRAGGWPHRLTYRKEGVDFAAVSPDGRQVVLGYDRDGDEDWGLWLLGTRDEDAGKETALDVSPGVQRASVRWSKEGDRIFFRSNAASKADFHLVEMRLPERTTRTVLERPGSWSVVDVAPGAQRLLVRHDRGGPNSSLYVLSLGDGALVEIDPLPEGRRAHLDSARFLAEFDAVVFASDRGGEWVRPWIACLNDASVRPLLWGETRETPEPIDVDGLEASPDGSRVWLLVNRGGRGELRTVDVASGRYVPAPRTRRAIAGDLELDADGSVYVVVSDATEPGRVVRFDRGRDEPAFLTYPESGPATRAEPARHVEYPSFDGRKVPAWLYLPTGKEPKGLPFLLHVHGGPEGQERPTFHAERAYWLSLGIGVLAPNVRGSTGYGRAYAAMDDYKGRAGSVADAKAAADWLIAEGLADPKRIAVSGGSYGGFMVLALLSEHPDVFAAGIDVVGIANFETFLENTASYRRALREAEYGPLSDRDFLRSVSPIHKVDRIKAPLLIAHGEKDPRVPVSEARQMEQALKDLGRPVRAIYFRDEGHGIQNRANKRAFTRAAAEHLVRHLGLPYEPPRRRAPAGR
jgi:dipeptidyl aminopeptidase/acylaminoacyl peptidase